MKVLLVDDHAPIRRGIRQLLELRAEFEVVGEGANGEEAVRQVDELEPDIVLMDMNMPVMNGADATRLIKERHPDVHVVGLTAFGEMSLVSAMVNAGAAGYLLKGGAPDELIDSLNAVARGQGALDKGVTKAVMDDMAEMHKKEAKAYAELDKMKSEFVSVITHELRTPLTSIKGGVHTLKRGWNEVDEQMKLEFLDSIDRQCDRLSNMIEKILLVSGIQRGGLGLEPTIFRLDNITREAMDVLATKSAGRTVVLDTAPVEATGDPKRLMEVIVALLDNALTFTKGRIDLSVGLAGDSPLRKGQGRGAGDGTGHARSHAPGPLHPGRLIFHSRHRGSWPLALHRETDDRRLAGSATGDDRPRAGFLVHDVPHLAQRVVPTGAVAAEAGPRSGHSDGSNGCPRPARGCARSSRSPDSKRTSG